MFDGSSADPSLFKPAVLSWLKIVSFCLTSLLALLGLMFDFKNKKTHRLTKWGRVNLIVLAIAFGVGIAAQVKEDLDRKATEDEQKKTLASLIVSSTSSLNEADANSKTLESIITNNKELITNTTNALIAAQTTDKHVGSVLHDTERTMQMIGNSIEVDYEYRLALAEYEQDALQANVNSLITERSKKLPLIMQVKPKINKAGYYDVCGFRGSDELFTNNPDGCMVMVGAQSTVLKSERLMGLNILARSPPFSIEILGSKPPIYTSTKQMFDHRNDHVVLPQPIATYAYDLDQGQVTFESISKDGVHSRPILMFVEGSSSILYTSDNAVRFRQNDLLNQVLSVLDLGGKYLRIAQRNDIAYVCRLTLQIGPRFFQVPIGDAERDFQGNYIYQFPRDMKQTLSDIQRARATQGECDEEALSLKK